MFKKNVIMLDISFTLPRQFRVMLNVFSSLPFKFLLNPFTPGHVFGESGRNDSSRYGQRSDSRECNDGTKNPPEDRDGADVAISDGGQRGNSPPQARKSVTERPWLGVVFGRVHQERGNYHQNSDST